MSYGNFKSRVGSVVTLTLVATWMPGGEIYEGLQSSTGGEGCNTWDVTHDDDSAARDPTQGANDS